MNHQNRTLPASTSPVKKSGAWKSNTIPPIRDAMENRVFINCIPICINTFKATSRIIPSTQSSKVMFSFKLEAAFKNTQMKKTFIMDNPIPIAQGYRVSVTNFQVAGEKCWGS